MPGGHTAANRSLSVTVPSCSESSAHPGLQGAESRSGRHTLPRASVPPRGPSRVLRSSANQGTSPPPATPAQWPRAPGHRVTGRRPCIHREGWGCRPAAELRGPLHTPGAAAEPPEDDHVAWGYHSSSGNPQKLKTLQGCLCTARGRPWRGQDGAEVPGDKQWTEGLGRSQVPGLGGTHGRKGRANPEAMCFQRGIADSLQAPPPMPVPTTGRMAGWPLLCGL